MSYNYRDFWKNTRFGGVPDHNYDEFILSVLEPGSVLDVGCGAGRFVETLSKDHAYVGIDISESAINQAKEDYPEQVFSCKDIVKDKIGMQFDNVFTWTALEHVPPEHIKAVANKLKKAAKKNIIICEPFNEGELAEHCFNHDYPSLFKVERKIDLGSVVIYKCGK